jgi:hypothetical protein
MTRTRSNGGARPPLAVAAFLVAFHPHRLNYTKVRAQFKLRDLSRS